MYDDNKDNNITLCTLLVVFLHNKNIIIILDDVLIETLLSRYLFLCVILSPSHWYQRTTHYYCNPVFTVGVHSFLIEKGYSSSYSYGSTTTVMAQRLH